MVEKDVDIDVDKTEVTSLFTKVSDDLDINAPKFYEKKFAIIENGVADDYERKIGS